MTNIIEFCITFHRPLVFLKLREFTRKKHQFLCGSSKRIWLPVSFFFTNSRQGQASYILMLIEKLIDLLKVAKIFFTPQFRLILNPSILVSVSHLSLCLFVRTPPPAPARPIQRLEHVCSCSWQLYLCLPKTGNNQNVHQQVNG